MAPFPDEGPWSLPVEGFEFLAVTFAYLLDIVANGDHGAELLIRVENQFRLDRPDGTNCEFDVSTDPWETLIPVLALRHDRLQTAFARPDGTMAIHFASGHRISASPHPDYENFVRHRRARQNVLGFWPGHQSPIGRSTLRRYGFPHSTSGVRLGRRTRHRRRDLRRCGA